MKKAEICIGSTYSAKVSGKVVPVRIEREHATGGWNATNLTTGKNVHIKTAARLRAAHPADAFREPAKDADTGGTTPRAGKGKPKASTKATAKKKATERKHGDVPEKEKKMGVLDAAAAVLKQNKCAMSCTDIVDQAIDTGLWTTSGKTPHATLCAAIIREIRSKGQDARFEKTGRGRFALKG